MNGLNRSPTIVPQWARLCVGLLAMALVLAGCDSNDGGMDDDPDSTPATTIADVVDNTDNLSTLATALGATNRTDVLDDTSETFTVFAPSDDPAFGFYDVDFLTSNTDLLGSVLDYHVVQGAAVTSDQLSDGDTFTTVQGDEIEVSIDEDGNVFVEGAPITTADVEADNGVAHVIGDVLLTNRTAAERLQVTSATEQLYQAIDNAGLASAFGNADNNWTTFAPDNASFENADLSGFSDSEVQQILQYHVLDGVTNSADLVQLLSDNNGEVAVETLQGEDVTITEQDDGSIVFNGGQATLNLDRVDQRASNGIIHQIEGLLIPPSLSGDGSSIDVTVTIENVGSSAWEVTNVDGASNVAGSGENPSLTLTEGTRYRFVNNGGSAHPLGFQNSSDEYLLNQDGSGSLEDNSGINYEEDSDGVTFTYTQQLADAVADYRCTVHPSMEGTVETGQ